MADEAPQGARQEPKPFRRARDGASKSPAVSEKHRVKIRALRALLAANLNARP